jgi:hypothetical protein
MYLFRLGGQQLGCRLRFRRVKRYDVEFRQLAISCLSHLFTFLKTNSD